jgi:uncharacterized protein (TIGR02453 family)
MSTNRPRFPPAALTFLRALTRHNDRDWFRARKVEYERTVRAPMAALVEQLDADFRDFAPELLASPRRSIFRIYRDTRFTEDKSPLKTTIAAVFPHRDLPKHASAALYLEVGPKRVLAAGGLYTPSPLQLRAVRQHVAANHSRLRTIVLAPGFVRATGGLQGNTLARMPRGFDADHAAAAFLRMKQFLIWKEWPASLAVSARFYASVLSVFRAGAPLVRFLNEPLVGRPGHPGDRLG